MKTQIIHLETHDDTISVKDKMEWSQLTRVLLIFPPDGRVLESQLDLVLLERHCTGLGSQLGLVTKDPEIRAHARSAGIPVFSSKREAQNNPWRRSWRVFQRQNLQEDAARIRENNLRELRPNREPLYELPSWGRISVFSAGVLAVLVFAALLLPRAEITIPPQRAWREMTVPVLADTAIDQVQLSGQLPAAELSVSVAGVGETPATGTYRVPDQYASGAVVFQNLTDREITVPEGTVLISPGSTQVLFTTRESTVVTPGDDRGNPVSIQAVEPGTQGNLPAGAVNQIAAAFGADLTVVNPEPTDGGSDLFVKAPSAADRQRLLESLTADLRENARDNLQTILEPGDILLSELPEIKEVQEELYQPPGEDPSDTLQLNLRIQFSALVVEQEDLQQLAEEIIRSSYVGSSFQPLLDTLEVENQTRPLMVSTDTARWRIQLRWREAADVQEKTLVRQLLGLPPEKAAQKLGNLLDLDRRPSIKLQPDWWFRLPLLPFRINIR